MLGAATAAGYDADAAAFFARAGALTEGRKALINTFVVGLKADGVWSKVDALWLLANETSAAAGKNVRKDDHHITAVNSPTFTVDRGYAGDGATSYLRTDYIPSTDGVALSLNSCSIGVYVRTARAAGSGANIGSQSGTDEFYIDAWWTGSSFIALNGPFNGALQTNSQGNWTGSRTGASNEENYLNGVSFETPNAAASALSTNEVYICANNNGAPVQHVSDETAFAFIGGGLTDAEVAAFHARVETYMDAVGAGVA